MCLGLGFGCILVLHTYLLVLTAPIFVRAEKRDERVGTMELNAIQTFCALKNDVCEKIQVVIDLEKNLLTINPEKCVGCPFLEERIRRSVIVLSGSPIPEMYKRATFTIDFDLQIPRRILQAE